MTDQGLVPWLLDSKDHLQQQGEGEVQKVKCNAAADYFQQMDWTPHLGRRPLSHKPKPSPHSKFYLMIFVGRQQTRI